MEKEIAYRTAANIFVGDVIRSEHFIWGRSWLGPVTVGYAGPKEDREDNEFAETDHDDSRSSACFVVEEADFKGGSFTQCRPDGKYVLARRLHDDGTYDPDGKLVEFWMSNHSPCIEQVELLKAMRRKIVFE
ncbi:MAG: hypothetical protein P4L53_03670 [Candidatus Obscuribacterales bacterium]|nr:hypothetical protein [Candidatus Obscuribacterales bacterium]